MAETESKETKEAIKEMTWVLTIIFLIIASWLSYVVGKRRDNDRH